jgi:hypothetical protein
VGGAARLHYDSGLRQLRETGQKLRPRHTSPPRDPAGIVRNDDLEEWLCAIYGDERILHVDSSDPLARSDFGTR